MSDPYASPESTTSAFVLDGRDESLRMETLSLAPPRQDEVLVEVAACGVCHTDLHVIKDEVAFPRPAVLGHEISGVVRQVGSTVEHVRPGDRVVCSFIMPCGRCRHCRAGKEELCETFFEQNRLHGRLLDGSTRMARPSGEDVAMYSMAGHAQRTVVPASAVFRIPDEVPLAEAAILGCSIFTAFGSVRTVADIQRGEDVAVIAAGGIGLSIILLARSMGARRIIAIDVDDDKLDLARQLGATDTVNSRRDDAIRATREVLGRGADVVFEALGSHDTARLALDLVDDGGRVVLTGIAPAGHTLETEIARLVRRKIQVKGAFGARASEAMPAVIAMAAQQQIDLTRLITDRFSFEETDVAYRALRSGNVLGRAVIEVNDQLV